MGFFPTTALQIIGGLILLSFSSYAVLSLREYERRTARISIAIAVVGGLFFLMLSSQSLTAQWISLGLTAAVLLAWAILFLLPIGKLEPRVETPDRRIDERDIMFARARLKPGTDSYESYYALHPEKKEVDDRIRSRPGLLSPKSKYANPFLFAAPIGSFFTTEALREAVDGPVAEEQNAMPPEKMTRYIKELAKYYGALTVGVTELKPYHVYSNIGRGTGPYGDPIAVEHRWAVAFTVQMDHDMIGENPYAPGVMESAHEYVEVARIAVQLAAAIRSLGYPSRAHIDGNYRVIAPLVARDAGLGEIGRIGLLITPQYGPRVRIGVVTTDIPLVADTYVPDMGVIDFCNNCQKCAENCPTRSIPFGPRKEVNGALCWKINPETCYHLWTAVGTDCGVCLSVCPYAHPNHPAHNAVRWGVTKSGFYRRFARLTDDFFYGRKRAPHDAPDWTHIP